MREWTGAWMGVWLCGEEVEEEEEDVQRSLPGRLGSIGGEQ